MDGKRLPALTIKKGQDTPIPGDNPPMPGDNKPRGDDNFCGHNTLIRSRRRCDRRKFRKSSQILLCGLMWMNNEDFIRRYRGVCESSTSQCEYACVYVCVSVSVWMSLCVWQLKSAIDRAPHNPAAWFSMFVDSGGISRTTPVWVVWKMKMLYPLIDMIGREYGL